MAGPKHPRHYDEAFKRQIAQPCESGEPSREIRAGYDIARSTPRRWVQGIPTAVPPGPWTTARPGRTSRSGRGGATGSWRWRWTFQDKRRRYSHEGGRDTGQRRPLPDISAMQDTGRSPLHLLLDDRASRDGACGSDRRRRARGPARQPRTLRRQKDQGRLGKEGRYRVREAHRRHHARTGHDGRVRAQTIRTARDSRAWFRLLVSNRGSFVLANEEIVYRTRAMPFTSKTETQSAQEFGRYRYRRITVDRHAGSH